MYKTIKQEFEDAKCCPGVSRIVSCEYLGWLVTAIEHFTGDYYVLYYADGRTEIVHSNKVVVHLDNAPDDSLDITDPNFHAGIQDMRDQVQRN